MLPLLVPAGPGNTAPVDLLVAVALGACLFWVGSNSRRLRFPFAVSIAVFMAGGALGAIAGPVPSAGVVAIVQDIVLLLWCWAVVNVASTPQRLKTLLATWAYSSIVWVTLLAVGLLTGVSFFTGQTAREGSRTALTLHDPNVSANYYFVSMMVLWATQRPRRRGLRVAAYVLFLVALLSTGSNSGIVSTLVGVSVAMAAGIYRRWGAAPAVTLLACLLVGGYLASANISIAHLQQKAYASRYSFLRDGIGRGAVSVAQRDSLLHESKHLYESGGPLGAGPVSTKPRLQAELAPFVKEAHDDYFAALIERGVVGFIGLFFFMGSLGFRTVAVARTRGAALGAVVSKPNALVGAVAGTMVAETVYELLHVRHVWTLFAFVAAIAIWSRDWRGSGAS